MAGVAMDELQYQNDLLSVMNQKLQNSERMYRRICDTSPNAFIYYDFKQDKIAAMGKWNPNFIFQLHNIQDITKLYDYVDKEQVGRFRDTLFCEKQNLEQAETECFVPSQHIWFQCQTMVFYDEEQKPIEKIIRFYNVTNLKKQNEELLYLAYYDASTGLYNRNYFVRILSDWIDKAGKENNIVSVLFIDIDDFRKINDGLGILAGDELVQLFGQFLNELSNENVIVSHFSSDLFCIAIYDPCEIRNTEQIYKRIRERIQFPFQMIDGQELNISVCAGVAEYPESGKNALELINNAEIVMFKAKHSGKNMIQYFDRGILSNFLENVEIDHKLKEAINMKAFRLVFQPQYECISSALRGVEALIRWNDSDGKPVSPSMFIPVAEKNGTIIPIGNWVLNESLRQLREWKKVSKEKFIMSVNISAIQFKKNNFVPDILKLLEKYCIDPSLLELEITENVLIDDFEQVVQKIRSLRDFGIRVSLDDFGTGFSSLSYLKGLPIDTLKIDRAFIENVLTDEHTKIITESILSMVRKLGFETIVEGVETGEQLEYLQSIKCDNIQGFYLGKPMAPDKITEILENLET